MTVPEEVVVTFACLRSCSEDDEDEEEGVEDVPFHKPLPDRLGRSMTDEMAVSPLVVDEWLEG